MTLESPPIQVEGNTRICVLPFTTPSIEPSGGVRLCSAASIFNYLDETLMGSIHAGGLATVWRNEKFVNLRKALLTGENLPPYCDRCEYRFEGPPWLLALHMALVAVNKGGPDPDPEIAELIRRSKYRYPEYAAIAGRHGLWIEPLPALVGPLEEAAQALLQPGTTLAMRGPEQWSDLWVELSRELRERLADPSTEVFVAFRNLRDGQPAKAAPNIRISFEEEDPQRIRYGFLPVTPRVESGLRLPLSAFADLVPDFDPAAAVRLRVGGFGAEGSAVEFAALTLVAGEAIQGPVSRAGIERIAGGGEVPVSIDFNTLNRCNVSCTMCPYAIKYDDKGEAKEPIYRLTLEEYRHITEGMNVESAHFVGAYAEPLMNKDLFPMIRHARSQGARTAVTSNGMLMNRKFAEKIVDSGLGLLTISLHGATKAVAEAIMRGADFDKVLDNIRTLQEVKHERGASHPTIQINYVGQRSNIADLPPFVRLAESLGIGIIHFVHLLVTPGVAEGESLVNHPELLTRHVREAEGIARELGVQLYVSSSYQAVIEQHERRGSCR